MILIAGNSNRPLAEAISAYLNTPLTEATIRRFSDMEIFVEILENIRGEDVFVIQSTSYPANDNLMELLIIIDALRRASARRITTVLPYFGYARQDRKTGPRTPISAKLVANLITTAGANRVLTLDLHAGQIQGFFDIPLDNLTAEPVLVKDIETQYGRDNLVIVSPDVGGVIRARAIAKRLDAELARGGERQRLRHPWRSVRRRRRPGVIVAAVADRDHGQHHGDGGGSGVGECPPVDDRTAARRGDPPDQRRDLGLEPVPLIFPGVGTPGGRRRLFRSEGVPDG
jgi:phosphoribosylpyrophosphate synthetase